MKAVVVFESMFGNTRQIAEASAEGLARHLDVEVVEVGEAEREPDTDLLVVGAPTHAFGMSRPATREDAAKRAQGGVISRAMGLREWLADLPRARRSRSATTFDTRVRVPGLPGSAAKGAAKQLRRRDYAIVLPPQSFYVVGTPGPLHPGEVERAREWGDQLGRTYLSIEQVQHST